MEFKPRVAPKLIAFEVPNPLDCLTFQPSHYEQLSFYLLIQSIIKSSNRCRLYRRSTLNFCLRGTIESLDTDYLCRLY